MYLAVIILQFPRFALKLAVLMEERAETLLVASSVTVLQPSEDANARAVSDCNSAAFRGIAPRHP